MLTSDSVKCANNRQQRQTWEKIHMTKIFYPYSKTVAKEMICSEKKKKKKPFNVLHVKLIYIA